jgi:hypothetical protein
MGLEERLCNWGRERRGVYDPEDGQRVDAAWRRLDSYHRELLRMVYVWKAGREVACRRLKIRRHPSQIFELELASAKAAIKKILDDT